MRIDRAKQIESLLRNEFAPTELLVKDQSHLHAGHAGAQDGKGHFDVRIVSDKFANQNRLARHRAVFAALGDLMDTDIHALKIDAQTPIERSRP